MVNFHVVVRIRSSETELLSPRKWLVISQVERVPQFPSPKRAGPLTWSKIESKLHSSCTIEGFLVVR